jgi:peroxiredoxin
MVGKQYGVVYTLTDDVANAYNSSFGLSSYNGNDSNEIPLGATYVIGTDAVIRYAFIDPDYRKRAEPDTLLNVLSAIKLAQ